MVMLCLNFDTTEIPNFRIRIISLEPLSELFFGLNDPFSYPF